MGRVEASLQKLTEVHEEVMRVVTECSERQWESRSAAEDWPVGNVARHIALGYLQGRSWIETMAAGQEVTTKRDEIHAFNEENRTRQPDPVPDIQAFLEKAYARLATTIEGLGEEELDRAVYFGPAEAATPIEAVVKLTARHARQHLESIQQTLASPS